MGTIAASRAVMTTLQLGLASLLGLVVACASRVDEPGSGAADPPTEQAKLQATPACDLERSRVTFPAAACAACMQQKCCAPTAACFSGNPDCTALHACLVTCPADHAVVQVGGGSDAPPLDAKARRAVENPCAAACEDAHAASVALRSSYDSCIREQCMPACGE
jgi:hypothetical protein